MTIAATKWDELDRQWVELAVALGADGRRARLPLTWSQKETVTLDVVEAKLIQPDVKEYPEDEAIVMLRVKTLAGRVLEFDMALPWAAIVDATDQYDEVDGELVEHDYDFSKPEEIARYFGRGS